MTEKYEDNRDCDPYHVLKICQGYTGSKSLYNLNASLREDTHKKRVFFSVPTTKVLPSLH